MGFSIGFIVHYMMLIGNYILNIVPGAQISIRAYIRHSFFILKHIPAPISRMKSFKIFPLNDRHNSPVLTIRSSFIPSFQSSGGFQDENSVTHPLYSFSIIKNAHSCEHFFIIFLNFTMTLFQSEFFVRILQYQFHPIR